MKQKAFRCKEGDTLIFARVKGAVCKFSLWRMIMIKKTVTLLLMVLVIAATLFPFTQEVSAESKSKKKTIYVLTEVATTKYFDNGSLYGSDWKKIRYQKNGMPAKLTSKFYTETFKYNKKGYLKGGKIKEKGYGTSSYKTTVNKRGLPIKEVGKGSLNYTATMNYRKNGTLSSAVQRVSGAKYSYKYDKHGDVSYAIHNEGASYTKVKYKYVRDKDGHITAATQKRNYSEYPDYTVKCNVKNTYDSHGNLTKKEVEMVGYWKYVTTYKYRKMRVNRKYVKYLQCFKKNYTMQLSGCMGPLKRIRA